MIQKTLKPNMHKSMPDHKYLFMPVFLLLLCCTFVQAQVNPGTKPTMPASGTGSPDKPADIREKLVTLALQNPIYEIADRKVAIANYQVKKAKGSWLGLISLQGNLNEFAFKGATTTVDPVTHATTTTNPSTFYPKYNIGANLPLDIFSSKKNDVKAAKENMSIAEAEKNQRFREIKAEVLTKYEDYLLYQQRLEMQSQVTQDAKTVYLTAEKDFQEGSIKQEEYNKSYVAYTDQKMKQAEYLRNCNVIKLEIEKLIGVPMEEALKK